MKRWNRFLWWLGIPIGLAFLIWGPYFLRALILGHEAWWRIPLLGDAVFDTAAYLQPVGHAALGIPQAQLIAPFDKLIRLLVTLFSSASVAELWLIARWMSAAASVWVGAWAIRQWMEMPVRMARLTSAALWLSLALVLGMKPGMFSWLFPFGLLAFGLVPHISQRLHRHQLIPAIGFSIAALAVAALYPWYALFVAVWIGAMWATWFSRKPGYGAWWWVFAAVVGSVIAGSAAWWMTESTAGALRIAYYERLAFAESRMPFFSGTVLLTVFWIILFVPVVRRAIGAAARAAESAVLAWLSVLCCFLSSPFTGAFIQNDHFRAPAVIASWFSMALVWRLTASAEVRPRPPSRFTRIVCWTLIGISSAYTLRILAAPYAWNHDLLNILHLTHWFAFVLTSILVVRWMDGRPPLRAQTFGWVVGIVALMTGGIAWTATLHFEFRGMDRLERLQPLFSWVESNVAPSDGICTDHGGDGFSLDDQLSAVTGRVVRFAHTNQYHEEFDTAYLQRMRTVVGFFDIRGAGDDDAWQLQTAFNQFIVCEDFPWQSRLLKRMGFPQSRIDTLTGCPRALIDGRWAYVKDAIEHPQPDAAAFKNTCPYVVIPERAKPYWHLPEGYRETRVMDGVSVWSVR